jgi:hypothetical protein
MRAMGHPALPCLGIRSTHICNKNSKLSARSIMRELQDILRPVAEPMSMDTARVRYSTAVSTLPKQPATSPRIDPRTRNSGTAICAAVSNKLAQNMLPSQPPRPPRMQPTHRPHCCEYDTKTQAPPDYHTVYPRTQPPVSPTQTINWFHHQLPQRVLGRRSGHAVHLEDICLGGRLCCRSPPRRNDALQMR